MIALQRTFRFGDREYRLGDRTYIMGVLNITPDSFSDGGRFMDPEVAVAHAHSMVEAGAHFIDIGGESSRPGAEPVTLEEERRRVLPILERLASELDVPLSIDTYKSEMAREALEAGATVVNDISGLRHSPDMADVIAGSGASVIIMHMKGQPRNMQRDPRYDDVVEEILEFLEERAALAIERGIPGDRIVVDPGIGFGKTVEHNLAILARLPEFRTTGRPLLIGTSRKSFIGNILGADVGDRLEGTIASNVVAVTGGVDIVRVHDVVEVGRALELTDRIVRGDFGD